MEDEFSKDLDSKTYKKVNKLPGKGIKDNTINDKC